MKTIDYSQQRTTNDKLDITKGPHMHYSENMAVDKSDFHRHTMLWWKSGQMRISLYCEWGWMEWKVIIKETLPALSNWQISSLHYDGLRESYLAYCMSVLMCEYEY